LTTHTINIELLRPAEWNANRVPAKTLEKVRRSIETFGVVENLVVRAHPDEAGAFEVLSGNHRLQIFQELGFAEATVVVVDVDDAHARILAQALNRTRGVDDPEAYARLLDEILADVDVDEVTAFLPETESSVERALASISTQDLTDEAPPLPDKAQSVKGEIYELGPHRLICGDATQIEDLDALLAGERVDLVLTDPPYGVNYGDKDGRAIANDDLAGDDLTSFLWAAFANAAAHAVDGAPIYSWCSEATVVQFRTALEQAGWGYRQTLVWVKNHLVLGRQDYHWMHEPCLYGWKSGGTHRWYGGRDQVTVIDDDVDLKQLNKHDLIRLINAMRTAASATVLRHEKPRSSDLHPTMKPPALLAQLLLNSSRPGDAVLDLFGGSGSTLMACEHVGRRAFLVELDERYCDVIRERWAAYANHTDAIECGAR
jgi:DNA modification methylase